MKQSGFSLIEVVFVVLLSSIIGSTLLVGNRMIQKVTFDSQIRQVEHYIMMAEQLAVSTGKGYIVQCNVSGNKIYVKHNLKTVYRMELHKDITISCSTTENYISFHGTMAPSKAGTITLRHEKLKQQARITVRIATGKTTIYLEPI